MESSIIENGDGVLSISYRQLVVQILWHLSWRQILSFCKYYMMYLCMSKTTPGKYFRLLFQNEWKIYFHFFALSEFHITEWTS